MRKKAAPGPKIEVVSRLSSATIKEMRTPDGRVHIDTALAATAATAGTFLLRQLAGDLLDSQSPGTVIIVDSVNEAGPSVLGYAQNAAAAVGIEWDSSADAIPDDHCPHATHLELVRALERPLARILRENAVGRDQWTDYTMLAAVDLIVRSGPVLDAAIATRIVTSGFVQGAKTVPYPAND